MTPVIINYGLGNINSVYRACFELEPKTIVADDPKLLESADRILLPGVGAFSEGMKNLQNLGWQEAIYRNVVEKGKPLLGICLGMQLLASSSEEEGYTLGLNLIPGKVRKLDQLGCALRVPHMGWNDICLKVGNPLFSGISNQSDFYFAHSYAINSICEEYVLATVDYGALVTAAISKQHIFGVQFHPEKSSVVGRRLLANFLSYSSC